MTRADALTMALYEARKAVLQHLKSQGVKVQLIDAAARSLLAREWLKAHPELIKDE